MTMNDDNQHVQLIRDDFSLKWNYSVFWMYF